MFGNGTFMTQDTGNFFWDDTNNRLGLGTSSPSAQLNLVGTSEQLRLSYDASNYSSFIIDSTGKLTLSNNGNGVANFGSSGASFDVPVAFNAVGDVDFGYDLVLSNQTSSNITSWGPLSVVAGESFESNNLTLKTYGTGNIVADLSGTGAMWLTGTDTSIVFDTKTAADTDYWMGVVDDAGSDDDDLFVIGDGTVPGTNPFLTINTIGNVGIGTTSPTSKLHINETPANDPTTPTFAFGDGNTGLYEYVDDLLTVSTGGTITTHFNGAYIRGTSSDSYGLNNVVATGTSPTILPVWQDSNTGVGHAGADILSLIAGGTNVMNVTNGSVGVGTTSPTSLLDIASTAPTFRMTDTTASAKSFSITADGNLARFSEAAGTDIMAMDLANSRVGIGTTAPGGLLTVVGLGSSTGTALVVDANGIVYKDSSSKRYKENIEPLAVDFTKILELEPKSYDYKATGAPGIGYLAEDVAELGLSDLVVYDNEGHPDAIKYDRMPIYLLEIAKEQNKKLAELKDQVASLIAETSQSTQTSEATPSAPGDMLASMYDIYNQLVDFAQSLGLATQDGKLLVNSDMNVTGDSTLSELTVTGRITNGLIQIDPLENSVNVLGASCYTGTSDTLDKELCLDQTLYIQKTLAGAVDIMNGKVLIQPDGKLFVQGTVAAQKYDISTDVENPAAGKVTLKAGDTSIEITTTALTGKSLIFVTPDKPIAIGANKTADDKFEIRAVSGNSEDVEISWWVVN